MKKTLQPGVFEADLLKKKILNKIYQPTRFARFKQNKQKQGKKQTKKKQKQEKKQKKTRKKITKKEQKKKPITKKKF